MLIYEVPPNGQTSMIRFGGNLACVANTGFISPYITDQFKRQSGSKEILDSIWGDPLQELLKDGAIYQTLIRSLPRPRIVELSIGNWNASLGVYGSLDMNQRPIDKKAVNFYSTLHIGSHPRMALSIYRTFGDFGRAERMLRLTVHTDNELETIDAFYDRAGEIDPESIETKFYYFDAGYEAVLRFDGTPIDSKMRSHAAKPREKKSA